MPRFQKISRGLALKIIEQLIIHEDPNVQKLRKWVPLSIRMITKFILIRIKMVFNFSPE